MGEMKRSTEFQPSTESTFVVDETVFRKLNKLATKKTKVPPFVLSTRQTRISEADFQHFLESVPERSGVDRAHADLVHEIDGSSRVVVYERQGAIHGAVCEAIRTAIRRDPHVREFLHSPGVYVEGYAREPDGVLLVPSMPNPPRLNCRFPAVPQPSCLWEVAFDEPEPMLRTKLAEACTSPRLANVRVAFGVKISQSSMVALKLFRIDGAAEGECGALKAEFSTVACRDDTVLELEYSMLFASGLPGGAPAPTGSLKIDLYDIKGAVLDAIAAAAPAVAAPMRLAPLPPAPLSPTPPQHPAPSLPISLTPPSSSPPVVTLQLRAPSIKVPPEPASAKKPPSPLAKAAPVPKEEEPQGRQPIASSPKPCLPAPPGQSKKPSFRSMEEPQTQQSPVVAAAAAAPRALPTPPRAATAKEGQPASPRSQSIQILSPSRPGSPVLAHPRRVASELTTRRPSAPAPVKDATKIARAAAAVIGSPPLPAMKPMSPSRPAPPPPKK